MFYEFTPRGKEGEDKVRIRWLIEMSMLFIREDIYEVGVPASVYFMGILGYRKHTGQWREPVNYTNILVEGCHSRRWFDRTKVDS
jgi:hypothetical protein